MRSTGGPGVRRVLALAAVFGISGCVASMHQVDRADWGAIPTTQRVRITKLDGSAVSLLDVRAFTDHLEGTEAGPSRSARTAGVTSSAAREAGWQSIPLDSVEYIEIREVDVGAILVWVAGGATTLAIAQAMGKSDVRPNPSCPLIYSFDGAGFRLDSETYSGAVARALERTDVDNLDQLVQVDGTYRILLRNERPESQYTDALTLLAVDHPPEVSVFPDAEGQIHAVKGVRSPLHATGIVAPSPRADLQAVASADEQYWSAAPLEGADPARDGDLRDGLIVSFDRPAGSEALLLVRSRNTPLASHALQQFLELQGSELVAWYRRLDSDPGLRERTSGWIAREGHLQVFVEHSGRWEPAGAFRDVGPNLAKTQAVRLDLERIEGDRVRVRLESGRGLWDVDWIGLGTPALTDAEPAALPLARATGRNQQDLRRTLLEEDGNYHTALRGDQVELEFVGSPLPPGQARSLFARTRGFYHLYTTSDGPPQSGLAERILDEPLLGNRLLATWWQAQRGLPSAGALR